MNKKSLKIAAFVFTFLFAATTVAGLLSIEVGTDSVQVTAWDMNGNKIVDSFESKLASLERNEYVSVIVTASPSLEDMLAGLDATVRYRYDAIGAMSISIPVRNLPLLTKMSDVIRVSDAETEVRATLDSGTPVVQIPEAYQSYPYRGEGMVIAIIDTGIDNSHVDLDDNDPYNNYKVIAFKDFVNGQDDLSTPVSAYDDNGHGTHCASIAAGTGEADSRYRGVAYAAQLVGIKVLDSGGGGTLEGVLAGMQWVIDYRNTYSIDIASMSLGTNPSSSCDGTDEICLMADSIMESNVALFVAAGNHGHPERLYGYNTIGCPAASRYAITVGSVNDDGSHSSFSNEGPTGDGRLKPEICAAGSSITAAKANSGNGYVTYSGTSMATPMAAGIGALIRQADNSLSSFDVKNVLTTTALDKGEEGPDNTYGYGIAQAKDALDYVTGGGGTIDNPPSCSIVAPGEGETISGVYRVYVDATDDNGVSKVEVQIDSGSWVDITNNIDGDYYYYDWDTTAYSDGSHTVTARATDTNSQTASDSNGVTVNNGGGSTDDYMHVSSITYQAIYRGPNAWLTIYVSIVDQNGNPVSGATVTIDVQYPSGSVSTFTTTTGSDGVAVFDLGKTAKGSYTVTVTGVTHSSYTYDSSANVETTKTFSI